MSASSDLQHEVAKLLKKPRVVTMADNTTQEVKPVECSVIARIEKDQENDLEAALALQEGISIFIPPPMETSAMEDVPFVFFDGYQLTVRIMEIPSINGGNENAYTLKERVQLLLHWSNPGGLLPTYPLTLMKRPAALVEGVLDAPGFENNGKFLRVIEVYFQAVMQLNPCNATDAEPWQG